MYDTFIMTNMRLHNLCIEFVFYYFGVVRIFCFQCLGMGLKTISLGIIVEVNIQLQAQQHIAFSSASCDAF